MDSPTKIPEIGKLALSPDEPAMRLFISRTEIDQAKSRIAQDAGARAIYDRLLAEAHKAAQMAPDPLDESWWEQDKNKPWEQTYPRVYEKTALEPARYAHAAATLATAWLLSDDPAFADKAGDLLIMTALAGLKKLERIGRWVSWC